MTYGAGYGVDVRGRGRPGSAGAPPTDVVLTNSETVETAAVGSLVGYLIAVDDSGAAATWSLTDDGGGLFRVTGNRLEPAADLSGQTSVSVTVQANNGFGTFDKQFTITVKAPAMEWGQAVTDQTPLAVNFTEQFANPVVVAWIATNVGVAAAAPRVYDVTATGFTVACREVSTDDGAHGVETIHWVAVERGDWTLADGSRVVAGVLPTAKVYHSARDDGQDTASFLTPFTSTPVVLCGPQTANASATEYLGARARYIRTDGVDLALMPEELASGAHVAEDVAYVAFELGDRSVGGTSFEVKTVSGVDHNPVAAGSLYATPLVHPQGVTGFDPGFPRYDGTNWWFQEETSADAEIIHGPEVFGVVEVNAASGSFALNVYGGTVGTPVYDDGFEVPPEQHRTNNGEKIKIPGKTGGVAKFILDVGAPVAGSRLTVKASYDWSNLSNGGREVLTGFGFLNAEDDFHIVGLKGDGGDPTTVVRRHQLYGSGSFRGSSGWTDEDGGVATNGTYLGPNWMQLEVSEDGLSFTYRTSTDGVTWSDELTAETSSVFADLTTATKFGFAAFFSNSDKGVFEVSLEYWLEDVANPSPEYQYLGLSNYAMPSGQNVRTIPVSSLGPRSPYRRFVLMLGMTHTLAASRSVTSVVLSNFKEADDTPVAGGPVTMTEHQDYASTGHTSSSFSTDQVPADADKCDLTITLSGNGHSAFGMVFHWYWLKGFKATPALDEFGFSNATYSESQSWVDNAVLLGLYVGKSSIDTSVTGLSQADATNTVPFTTSDGRVSIASEQKTPGGSGNVGWTSGGTTSNRRMIITNWSPLD